jgi:large subunit ribosomal protein L24
MKANTYLKKNDQVMVITGKYKGKTGRLLMLIPKKSTALVEKINLVKRHQKPTAAKRQGGIVEKEAGIQISNLLLYCSRCEKGVRISQKVVNGKKTRVCKKCGETIEAAAKK